MKIVVLMRWAILPLATVALSQLAYYLSYYTCKIASVVAYCSGIEIFADYCAHYSLGAVFVLSSKWIAPSKKYQIGIISLTLIFVVAVLMLILHWLTGTMTISFLIKVLLTVIGGFQGFYCRYESNIHVKEPSSIFDNMKA